MGRLRFCAGLWLIFVAFCATAQAQLFTPSGFRIGVAGGATTRTFPSQNGMYQLTLEVVAKPIPPANWNVTINAFMSKVEKDSKTILWATNYTGGSVQYMAMSDVIVSNGGDFFLLTRGRRNDIAVYRKDRRFDIDGGDYGSSDFFLTLPETLLALDELQGEKVVRIWNREKNVWRAFQLLNGTEVTGEVKPEIAARWTETTRQEIRERIYGAKREMLRRKVGEKAAPLAKLANVAMSQQTNVAALEIDYEFLTLQRNGEDRKFLEELLNEGEAYSRPGFGFYGGSGRKPVADFVSTDFVRARVDWLLGLWEKRIDKATKPRHEPWAVEHELPRFHIGKVFGKIVFAGPINFSLDGPPTGPTWAGPRVHLRLIPIDKGKGSAPLKTETLDHPLWERLDRNVEVVEDATFAFTTVRPGTYRVKAIWDKRAPYDSTNGAGPGDYEAALSKPIRVEAGGVISNIVLYCTNRAAGGEAYYAADEALRQKWKVTGELTPFSITPDADGITDTFWRNASYWLVATNRAAAANFATIESIGTTTSPRVRGSDIARPQRLVVVLRRAAAGKSKAFDGPSDLRISDEHGCSFRQAYWHDTERTIRYTFFQFPRSSRFWRLTGYSRPFDSKITDADKIFDYTITNLVWSPSREVKPAALPMEIDLGPVKMKLLAVSQKYLQPEIEAKFYKAGQPVLDWHIREAIIADAEGNFINPREICSEQKAFRVIGRAGRNQPMTTIPFEAAVEREKK